MANQKPNELYAMRKYQQILGLKTDPFQLATKPKSFFGGAGRQEILDALVRHVHYGEGASVVTGPLGSGKTVLVQQFLKSFAEEALAISVHASLFMNQAQFLEALLEQLPVGASSPEPTVILEDLVRFAGQQEKQARTLVLVIDDAHELASEVFELIAALMQRLPPSALHICLLGEHHLVGMLENTINANLLGKVEQFKLKPFSAEDTCEYVQHRLVGVGYQGTLPVATGRLGAICNDANGVPGAMTSAIADLLENELQEDLQTIPVRSALQFSSRYWQAAGGLFVVALLIWLTGPETGQETAGRQSLDQVANASPQQRQRIAVGVSPSGTAQTSNAESASAANAATEPAGLSELPTRLLGSQADQQAATEIALNVSEHLLTKTIEEAEIGLSASNSGVNSTHAIQVEPETTAISSVRSESLPDQANAGIGLDAGDYTIQLMGSRSEESVIKFLAGAELPYKSGYFETRYQGEPWFVVVSGVFGSRAQANEGIAKLPAGVQELQPWVRAAADIKSSVRTLQALN